MIEALGKEDIAIPKSRDMGVSWITLAVIEWAWHFRPMQSFLLASRTEEFVDAKGDPKTLFWKIDYILSHQPKWLVPSMDRVTMHLENKTNGSVIDGSATHVNLARGDRRTAIVLDEFAAVDDTELGMGRAVNASTGDATSCRIFVSTHKGTNTNFYEVCTKSGCRTIKLHWTLHPHKRKGLYFDAKGKPRSPWYDERCKRANYDPITIAQELDIDAAGSVGPVFDLEVLAKIESRDIRDHVWEGDIACEGAQVTGLNEQRGGPFKLWIKPPSKDEKWGTDIPVAVGIDISQGTGASNSTASFINRKTGEKIAEYANPLIRPEFYAPLIVALARWMNDAFLCWDAGGPGAGFGARVLELGYSNVYYHRRDDVVTRDVTLKPGYHLVARARQMLFQNYRSALVAGAFIQRSRDALEECRKYAWVDGKVVFVKGGAEVDSSGAGESHGDRCVADALACHAIRERPAYEEEKKKFIGPGTFGYRIEQQMEQERRERFAQVRMSF